MPYYATRGWRLKLGTIPWGAVIYRHRYRLEPGRVIQFRENRPGSKWEKATIDRIDPDLEYILASL